MKSITNAKPRAIALLLAAVALHATPLLAQEVAAPPPVAETVATPAAPAPAPEAAPAPAPAAQAPVFAPKQEVVQPLPPRPAPPVVAEEEAAPAPVARSQPARRVARAAPAPVAAPVAAAPVAAPTAVAPTPAPVTATPAPEAAPATIPVETAPEPTAADTAATTTTQTTTTTTPWMWIGLGIVALAALAMIFLRGRKRREEDVYYEEPVMAEPVIATASVVPVVPVTKAPVATVPVSEPVKRTAPVADDERPWIGLSIWPKEANGDTVQYDLVVENVGDVEAHDVRVSSLIIDGTQSTPMENALIEDGETRSIDVSAGHSIPIAQTIAVAEGKAPHILAEARYPLPGGGEGHIAARFALDTAEDGTVEARLDDLLERV